MQSLIIKSKTKIKKIIPKIESRLKIKISLVKNTVSISGEEFNQYLALHMLEAVDFGFDIDDVLLLINPDFIIDFISIKEHTKKHNLKEVRARVIGTQGKAKKVIELLTGAKIVIHDNLVGVIAESERMEAARQAMISLIQGANHANVFAYLEKQNAKFNMRDSGDLGIREKFQKYNE